MSRAALVVVDAAVFGPMRQSAARTLLAVVAIALGVALGLAIYLINRTAADEVSLAARSLYGLADLTIQGTPQAFPEDLYPRVAKLPGIAAASPVVEVDAKLIGRRGAIALLGVDAFRSRALQPAFGALAGGAASGGFVTFDPQAVFLSAQAARDLGLLAGDVLQVQWGLQTVRFKVAGVLPPAALRGRAGIVDIATAQWRFGRLGELSRIDLRLAPGVSAAAIARSLTELLPPSAKVTTPGDATDDALRLSRSYRANLTALALVALFTGGFFVYSTQSLAALRRRREFAVLHALGVTRGQQLALILFGSALLGICGALAGIALGAALAALGLNVLGTDLGAGYFRGLASGLELRPVEAAAFSLLGVIVAIAGALRPAIDAARIPTASALKAGDVASHELRTRAPLVLALFAAAACLLMLPPVDTLPLPGYASIALLMVGTVVAMPGIIRRLLGWLPRLRSVPYQIAVAQLAGTARYATLSASAIVVSFSLMVAMAIMVTSFRSSLDLWTQKLLPADLYLRAGYVGQSAYIDPRTLQALQRIPGVARIDGSRFGELKIAAPGAGDRPAVTLIARSLHAPRIEDSLWVTATAQTAARPGEIDVWINEAAADLFAWAAGDSLQFVLGRQQVSASVRGIWRDYEHGNGAIVMERADYVRLSRDDTVNTIWFWLDEDASEQEVRRAIHEIMPAGSFEMRAPGELRRLSLQAFDRTFAVTYLLELVAVTIGLFGIGAGMSAQVLARRGEFGALRHLGLTRGQIAAMLAIEGTVLGAAGVIVGLLNGAAVSLILIYVVNRQSFHWSMDLFAPPVLLTSLSLALIACAAAIAVMSGRRAMSGDVVRAVKEDW